MATRNGNGNGAFTVRLTSDYGEESTPTCQSGAKLSSVVTLSDKVVILVNGMQAKRDIELRPNDHILVQPKSGKARG